jgi:two-component system NarL family response regulator
VGSEGHGGAATIKFPPGQGSQNPSQRLNGLTQRERDVLACLAAGGGNRAIAEQLGIAEGTVRSHVHVLLQKLQVSNRTQAALIWLATEGRQ